MISCSKYRLISVILCMMLSVAYSQDLFSQNFSNSDLEGSFFGFSDLPDEWQRVPVGDPISVASNTNIGDTPDLTDINGPGDDNGVLGIPFSGDTFITGLRMSNNVAFHEGIQQTVDGFEVGETYLLEFYQSVVKQVFALDNTGSWSVYMDDVLLGVSELSTSNLSFDDPNLNWDMRSMIFQPTSSEHTFKFMPTDNDSNDSNSFTDEEAGLRMGIDLITISTGPECVLDLGDDIELCANELPITLESNLEGAYIWSNGEETAAIEITEGGVYALEVEAECGTAIDEVTIVVTQAPGNISLGEDQFICENLLPVDIQIPPSDLVVEWSTGEDQAQISVTTQGTYSVQVSNECGTSEASVVISTFSNEIQEEVLDICQGDSASFLGQTFTEPGVYELSIPADSPLECPSFWTVTVNEFLTDTITQLYDLQEDEVLSINGLNISEPGVYFVEETSSSGCVRSVQIIVSQEPEVLVWVPSALTPDGNGLNEVFKPIITLVGNVELTDFNFEIYNRWGELIHESIDYDLSDWNGSSSINGDYYAQDGVYNWVLTYSTSRSADREEKFGSVVVLR